MLTPLLWHTVRGTGIDPVAAEDVVQTIVDAAAAQQRLHP